MDFLVPLVLQLPFASPLLFMSPYVQSPTVIFYLLPFSPRLSPCAQVFNNLDDGVRHLHP